MVSLMQDIYMPRPNGLTDAHMPPVVRLRKCLYGLPMASAMFKEHCNKALIDMDFRANISDPGLYLKQLDTGDMLMISVLYRLQLLLARKLWLK